MIFSAMNLSHVGQACQPAGAGDFPVARPAQSQRGIALVVTLILLSVITTLAVAFLFLSRRERASVSTLLDQTAAKLAAEAGTERAKAEMLADIMSTTNGFNYGLRVSTTFSDPNGFQPGVASLTNVNYDFRRDGQPFTANDLIQNIANLFYDPRPPVFITDRRTGVTDFRYYLDLNRNGAFETNGLLPVLTGIPGFPYYDTNGNPVASFSPPNIQSNRYVGDPEFKGLLERPDRPHSASNKFVGRFATIVVPSGMTLDLNTIGNQVKMLNPATDGYSRNMGMGPWELNLPAFLVDLNTNLWNPGPLPNYAYNTNIAVSSTGTAFDDARDIVRYRYAGDWNNLRSVSQLFGGLGAAAFRTDLADGYGRGPLQLGPGLPGLDPDLTLNNVSFGWPGADNPNHFFTTQDLFDPAKSSANFVTRLLLAGTGASSYNRYTYYRMLAQLGTDTGPEPAGKMDLNFANVDAAGKVVPDAQTNFVAWTPLQFFTNAADRLLRATFNNVNENRQLFGVPVVTLTNVPVVVSNQFVYSPSLHHVFQLAANIYDASTNFSAAPDRGGADLPSVFRPTFRRVANGSYTDIYLTGWTEITAANAVTEYSKIPLDLHDPVARASLVGNENVYGVPWVIGAKKGFANPHQGLPNFNKFVIQSVGQLSRKLQLSRPSATSRPTATNQMFIVGVSNMCAFEAWNSYRDAYPRDVRIILANDMLINLTYTNDVPLDLRGASSTVQVQMGIVTNIAANSWSGYGYQISDPVKQSFVVPLQTNINFLPDSIFRTASGALAFTTNIAQGAGLSYGFEQTRQFQIPQFYFAVSNRVRFIMLDTATGRVIDYVQLNDLNNVRNLTAELNDSKIAGIDSREQSLWATNRPGGNSLSSAPQGLINQILVALGDIDVTDWNSYGQGQANGQSKQKAIDGFRVFMGLAPKYFPGTANSNLVVQVPFTPTRRTSQTISWEANDPLVHYTAGDLLDVTRANTLLREIPGSPLQAVLDIGDLSKRYAPWGGYPKSSSTKSDTGVDNFSLLAKDPGVRASDDWDFPANKFPTVGWLGRVHRGTPWQTVYLKASTNLDAAAWTKWTGNSNRLDAAKLMPANDRVIFDVFTTAFNADSTRGQLNVNQPGLAAWSAGLSGIIGLTNTVPDAQLVAGRSVSVTAPFVIDPAGADPNGLTNSVLGKIWMGITAARASQPRGYFARTADILSTPELTEKSPILNLSAKQQELGISDAAYERLPQMLMGLLRGADNPRFTIYSYGQALKPANNSIVRSGPYFGLCTNYQITAEFVTRTVVRIDGSPAAPKAVVESFNILPPE
jgi:hypothetical protein